MLQEISVYKGQVSNLDIAFGDYLHLLSLPIQGKNMLYNYSTTPPTYYYPKMSREMVGVLQAQSNHINGVFPSLHSPDNKNLYNSNISK